MNTNLTEMIFILDRSGSMSGLESDTIGGYNGLLAKQKKEPGEALVTTVLFDSEYTIIHDRVNLQQVRFLTEEDYQVGGCTALMDAVGDTVEKIVHLQKHLRKEDKPGKTVVCIITDGMENASRRYRKSDIKKIISDAQEKEKWEFIFLGANIDAADEAESYGIRRNRAVKYCCDEEGTEKNFHWMNKTMSCVRAPMAMSKEDCEEAITGILDKMREDCDPKDSTHKE